MASVKVSQLRKTLEAFANIYENAGAVEQAAALRQLSASMAKADKRTVDDLVNILSTGGQQGQIKQSLGRGH